MLEWFFLLVVLVCIRKHLISLSIADIMIFKRSQKEEESDKNHPGCDSRSYQDGRLQKEEDHEAVPSENVQ